MYFFIFKHYFLKIILFGRLTITKISFLWLKVIKIFVTDVSLMVNSLLGMSLSLATDWDKTHGLVGTFGFAISWSASGIVASVGSLTKLFILVSVSFCRRNVSYSYILN